MLTKSFIALDGDGHLTGSRTAQTAPYDRYTCHLCGSALHYHPEYVSERPWFEHSSTGLTEHGRQHCPYVNPEPAELALAHRLQRFLPDARPRCRNADWHCEECGEDYHGERYCPRCRTGQHSTEITTA